MCQLIFVLTILGLGRGERMDDLRGGVIVSVAACLLVAPLVDGGGGLI